jgi:RHS repeat-associated protein
MEMARRRGPGLDSLLEADSSAVGVIEVDPLDSPRRPPCAARPIPHPHHARSDECTALSLAHRLANRAIVHETVRDTVNGLSGWRYGVRSTYRYDALGRRIWYETQRDTSCHTADASSGCRGSVTRTVWDGDQLLYEIRADTTSPENTSPSGPHYGVVGYTHGQGIDQPLGVVKGTAPDAFQITPLTNWRGQIDGGLCPATPCSSSVVWFPQRVAGMYGQPYAAGGPPGWFGSLIEGQRDASGLIYQRNRYLDPATGRFTQEDPIGFAGGLNLYAYADGDPVTFSDPFGLCPNRVAGGFGSLQCAIEDIIGAVRAGPGLILDAIRTSPHKSFVTQLALTPLTVFGGFEEAATARLAARLNFTGKTAGHMAEAGRWVPRHLLAATIRTGERMADPQGAEGAAKFVQTMYRMGKKAGEWKEYTLAVIYREKDNMILHFQYTPK